MSVTSTLSRSSYVGDGATTVYAYPFLIFAQGDLQVYVDGVLKTITTDYTISGVGVLTGGNVTFTVAPPSGKTVLLVRVLPIDQQTKIPTQDKFPSTTLEAALDKVTLLCQQLSEVDARCIKFGITSLFTNIIVPDPVALSYLQWNSTATALQNALALTGTTLPVGAVASLLGWVGSGPSWRTPAQANTDLATQTTIASAAALPVTADKYQLVSGTTTITSLATLAAGLVVRLRFLGALTLTNSANLILQGGVNYVTAAGDTFEFVSEGGGVWRELSRHSLANNDTTHFLRGDGTFQVLPATALGSYGVRNLVGQNDSVTPNTKYGYSADLVQLHNPSDGTVVVRTNTGTLTNDIGLVAPNGRDQTPAFSASTWVHFYFVWNGTILATVSSATAPPVGPSQFSGYTHWAYVGAVFYNATPLLVKTRMRGTWMIYEAAQNALSAGAATVETAVSLTSFVPPNALQSALRVDMNAANVASAIVTNKIRFIAGNDWLNIRMIERGEFHITQTIVPNQSQQIFYLDAAATDTTTIDVLGFSIPNGGE